MFNRNFLLILSSFIILFSSNIISQELPNYPERNLQEKLDSLRSVSQIDYTQISATEGIINPEKYRVGPGDKLFISITGISETVHNLTINQEGYLYIPRVGGINLQNLTLAEAKNKIIDSINRYYRNVNIFISLVDFRKIKVSLVGDVILPGINIFNANARLMDLISSSQGLNETANYRNIKIKSKDGNDTQYDFLSFLRFGDYSQNPILREGDVVIIDKTDKIVRISGEVKYPATYEYIEGETPDDLIKLAGGFLSTARTDSLEIISFDNSGKTQQSKYFATENLKSNNYLLKHKDHVIIRQIPEYLVENYVHIDGFVNYPGWYKIIKDKTTLRDIIFEAGGFRKEASLTEATLTRTVKSDEKDPEFERLKLIEAKDMTEDEYDYFKSRSRQNTGRVVVDFVDLFINDSLKENIILRHFDLIKIPEKKDYIIMLGQFINPGKIIYDQALGVNDYIELAGGFGWRAQEGEVRVIKAKTGEWIEADEVEKLEAGDTIWVPEDPPGPKFWDVFLDGLQILAQVAAIVAAAAALVVATR